LLRFRDVTTERTDDGSTLASIVYLAIKVGRQSDRTFMISGAQQEHTGNKKSKGIGLWSA